MPLSFTIRINLCVEVEDGELSVPCQLLQLTEEELQVLVTNRTTLIDVDRDVGGVIPPCTGSNRTVGGVDAVPASNP